MADFQLGANQNVDVAIGFTDAEGNATTATLDPGSATATLSDGTTLTATISADQTSVNVRSGDAAATDNVLTVTGNVNGVALTAGTLAFDVGTPVIQPNPAVAITLTPGTPVAN